MSPISNLKRTHNCGELRLEHAGQQIILNGWAATWRDHGGVIFIDLRDRHGRTQLTFNSDVAPEAYNTARDIKRESVLAIKGTVNDRGENRNDRIPTGAIEVVVSEVKILSVSEALPFELVDEPKASEELRLRNRVLDLRRSYLQDILIARSKANQVVRTYFTDNDFLELETPILTKATPEGARDFLVPSRISHGGFYALPQSPQLFKQMFMVAGFERYFQITKCFRDEDLRHDRQPEFTQIDVEMSFVDEEDVMATAEGMLVRMWKEIKGVDIPTPFPRMSFDESIAKYGTDAPDLRFGMPIIDMGEVFANTEFRVISGALEAGGLVRGLVVEGGASLSRKQIDALTNFVKAPENGGAGGLLWCKVNDEGALSGPLSKAATEGPVKDAFMELTGAKPGDLVVAVAAQESVVLMSLNKLRLKLGNDLGLINPDDLNFVWIVDFPMFEWDHENNRAVARHHPFTSPKEVDMDKLDSDPLKVYARAYDVVLNGSEIGGGSVRIHNSQVQRRVFKALGIEEAEAEEKFGFLLNAFRFGPPPHAGIAFGMDRICMIMTGTHSIRDVIPFPKTTKAACLMTEAPSGVDARQLEELHISVVPKPKAAADNGNGSGEEQQ